MATVDELFEAAMKLSDAERLELADRVWKTIVREDLDEGNLPPEELDEEWEKEIIDRIQRYERGESKAVDAFEALEEDRKWLRERRQP